MLVEIEAVSVPESDLEEVIVKTFLGDLDLLGSILKGILNLLVVVVDDPRVIFPPLDNFVNNVADPPLLGPPALGPLRHLISTRPVLLLARIHVLK